jgi:hypothetical protein
VFYITNQEVEKKKEKKKSVQLQRVKTAKKIIKKIMRLTHFIQGHAQNVIDKSTTETQRHSVHISQRVRAIGLGLGLGLGLEGSSSG